ncbi:hypothetical protein [Spinactinospora alkalitolerans]
MMCGPGTSTASTAEDTYVFDPGSLTTAQVMGDACAVCHAKWPRPRRPLGELPDGTGVYGCAECAGFVMAHNARALEHALAAH